MLSSCCCQVDANERVNQAFGQSLKSMSLLQRTPAKRSASDSDETDRDTRERVPPAPVSSMSSPSPSSSTSQQSRVPVDMSLRVGVETVQAVCHEPQAVVSTGTTPVTQSPAQVYERRAAPAPPGEGTEAVVFSSLERERNTSTVLSKY